MTESAPTETVEVDRESLSRALHSLQASEARVERNAERVYDETRSRLVAELLPILDNLDRALRADHQGAPVPFVEAFGMVRSQLESVLERYGVERIDAGGQRFDPALHEAIAAVSVRDPLVGMVIEQLEPGYQIGAKLLRPARVTVGVASSQVMRADAARGNLPGRA
jgi:molecular chaperone GrpE